VPHGHDVALADEDVRLAADDLAVDQLSGARHDKQCIAVAFELGMLVVLASILDGQRMKAELVLHTPQQVDRRFEQADPHDVTRLARPRPGLVEGNVGDAAPLGIHARRHQALFGAGRRDRHVAIHETLR
jgi:hypothetical protein